MKEEMEEKKKRLKHYTRKKNHSHVVNYKHRATRDLQEKRRKPKSPHTRETQSREPKDVHRVTCAPSFSVAAARSPRATCLRLRAARPCAAANSSGPVPPRLRLRCCHVYRPVLRRPARSSRPARRCRPWPATSFFSRWGMPLVGSVVFPTHLLRSRPRASGRTPVPNANFSHFFFFR